jgi:hypothetical protein
MKEIDQGMKNTLYADYQAYQGIITQLQIEQIDLELGIEICERLIGNLIRDLSILDEEECELFLKYKKTLGERNEKFLDLTQSQLDLTDEQWEKNKDIFTNIDSDYKLMHMKRRIIELYKEELQKTGHRDLVTYLGARNGRYHHHQPTSDEARGRRIDRHLGDKDQHRPGLGGRHLCGSRHWYKCRSECRLG